MKRKINIIIGIFAAVLFVASGTSVVSGQASKTQNVTVVNTAQDPVLVKVLPGPASRKPFQVRMFVGPKSTANDTSHFLIPVGKRLVIENVSAISRIPTGLKAEVSFFTYIDSNDDGIGDSQDITFHRIPLIDQGDF